MCFALLHNQSTSFPPPNSKNLESGVRRVQTALIACWQSLALLYREVGELSFGTVSSCKSSPANDTTILHTQEQSPAWSWKSVSVTNYLLGQYCPLLFHLCPLSSMEFGWLLRLSFAKDAAQGLAFLHSHQLVHSNLSTSTCVINQHWVLKLTCK